MRKKREYLAVIITVLCLIILILDTKTAIKGARNGIELCLMNIIPSLFPFCILSKIVSSALLGREIRFLQPIRRLTRMPKGTESILLLSVVSGYPLGAQYIDNAYQNGCISLEEATRMLAFCNNAGPAFIFGILSCLFPNALQLWLLYITHVLSAVIVGIIVPGGSDRDVRINNKATVTLQTAVDSGVKTISLICAWIVIFKIIQEYLQNWLTSNIQPIGKSLIAGFLELSNGCISLQQLECFGLRYILCAIFLGFGGFCISLQTMSVVKHVPLNKYFAGKIIQTAISGILATLTQYCIFSGNDVFSGIPIPFICLIATIFSTIILYHSKKVVAIA